MIWQELSIKVPQEYVEPICYLFGRYGHGISVEDAGEELALLRTYLPNTSKRRMARIEVGVNLVRILQPIGQLMVKELKEADWQNSWKEHYSLLRIGSRLAIKPTWIDYEPAGDEVVIELDPGMAFGTGYHQTTKMCLEVLECLIRPGVDVLDFGTGSGILAIAAARLGAASVLALDVDPTAVKAARKNFRASGLTNTIHLIRGSLPHRMVQGASFDLAAANISAKVIKDRAPHIHDVLKPGGMLIASGIVQQQQSELVEVLVDLGFSLLRTYNTEDWVALLLSKPPTTGSAEKAQ